MEIILKYFETASKYVFPVPLVLLLITLGLWAAFTPSWSERERYNYALLAALGKWEISISDRQAYYMEPGSEYRDSSIMALPDFQKHQTKGIEALTAVREQLSIASLYLSDKTMNLLYEMIVNHWQLNEIDAICNSDYLDKTLPIVRRAYEPVLADAKHDLKRSRYLALLNKFLPK